MIVRREDGHLLLMRQIDHAALSGEFATRLADAPAPVSALVAGAREHDNGWREADAAPVVDAETGRPHAYSDMPHAPYREIWERGMTRATALEPYLGLLVMLHGAQFFGRSKDPAHVSLFESTRAAIDEMLAKLGLDGSYDTLPEPARTHRDWIRFFDGLSLFVCEGWDSPWGADSPRGRIIVEQREPGRVTLQPWLFREPFAIEVAARVVADRPYASDEDLRAALDAAQYRTMRWAFAPA